MARLRNKAYDSIGKPPASSQESDYGGDFTQEEEAKLESLLKQYNSQYSTVAATSTPPATYERIAGINTTAGLGNGAVLHSSPRSFASVETLEELVQSGAFPAEVQLSVPKEPTNSHKTDPAEAGPAAPLVDTPNVDGDRRSSSARNLGNDADNVSPLGKFRARRPLSVTDLVSPAWCELQYSFSLHQHGRKRRTPAMKKGSAAHQKLEDEVHATFSVEVMTKEDAWGLRFWNIIQGARTLRETGMTRELEVWGVLNGELVNGVIDELSYECPDPELGLEQLALEEQHGERGDQQSIEKFFKSQSSAPSGLPSAGSAFTTVAGSQDALKVYLTDHKTRTSRGLPKASAFRPTAMQLMIYQKLLSDFASKSSTLDPAILWERYNVDPDKPFSDYFVRQFGDTPTSSQDSPFGGHDDQMSLPDTALSVSTPLQGSQPSTQSFHTQVTEPSPLTISLDDLNTILHVHRTPRELWTRMLAELKRAIPYGLGDVLRVQYWNQAESDELGTKTFLYDEKMLNSYVDRTMQWWKGERKACGVDVSDAWKCRICEFAENCDWRKDKEEEAVQRFRQNSKR